VNISDLLSLTEGAAVSLCVLILLGFAAIYVRETKRPRKARRRRREIVYILRV
jgi:hypothetical protein